MGSVYVGFSGVRSGVVSLSVCVCVSGGEDSPALQRGAQTDHDPFPAVELPAGTVPLVLLWIWLMTVRLGPCIRVYGCLPVCVCPVGDPLRCPDQKLQRSRLHPRQQEPMVEYRQSDGLP